MFRSHGPVSPGQSNHFLLHLLSGLLIAVLALFTSVSSAQQLTGSLSGTAYDQSGGIVPNATVTLKNEASGDVRTTTTNASGVFNISAVPPATYTITISANGFTSWQESGIVMNQGDKRALPNIALKVGSTSTAVEVVTGADAVVPVDTGEVSTTLNNHMVTDLSIQSRNAGEFLKIMPGMALANGISQGSSFNTQTVGTNSGPVGAYSANGTQPNGALAYMLDGANMVDPGNMGTQIANINQDMTAEIKVLMSSYGAEYAKGPVVFQAFSKSGGSQFHGEAYLYTRNSVLNSNDSFFNSQGLAKPDTHFYYPGGNIGGPIVLPFTHFNHDRNKLFFWAGYEYMSQQPSGSVHQYNVPTPEELAGNFSPAYLNSVPQGVKNAWPNAYTAPCPVSATLPGQSAQGSCNGNGPNGGNVIFPNGQIPTSMFDPNILGVLKLYPKPNITPSAANGYSNYEYVDNSPVNRWELTGKVDYSVSDNTKLSVSYTRQNENDLHPITIWWAPNWALPYPSPAAAATNAQDIMVNGTHVFSATLTNEAVFTLARFINPNTLSNPSAVDRSTVGFNVQGLFGHTTKQMPNIRGPWGGSLSGFEMPSYDGAFNGGAFGGLKQDPAFYDNVTKVWGTHTMKFGFYWDLNANQQSSGGNDNGFYMFGQGQTTTNNVVADLELGRGMNYQQASAVPVDNLKFHQYSFYGQDSWKFGRKLTLNYGLRFDHIGQWYDDGPGLQVWNSASYVNGPNAPPNTGLLWNAIDKKIPLSGFVSPTFYYEPRLGFAYDLFGNGKTVLRGGFAIFRYQLAFNSIQGAAEAPVGAFTYTTPTALTSYAQISQFTPPTSVNQAGSSNDVHALQQGDNKVPETKDWNFTISQALPWRSVFEISYVGNKSTNELLEGSGGGNINNLNNVPVGAFFQPDPKTGQIASLSSITANDYRPLSNYQNIYLYSHGSYANYNSLQVSWQKQTGPVTFLVNYTFSKVMGIRDGETDNGAGNGSLLDPFNLKNNYGVLAYDHTHILNAAYVFNLPSPMHGNLLARGVVNGWQLSGVTQIQSGAPIQPSTGGNMNAQFGNINGYGASPTTWLGTNAYNTLVPALTCDPRSHLSSGQYFNPGCFTVPAPGTQGAFIWPYIKTPAYFNSDLALYKNFRFGEHRSIQFRASAFNFLNHPLEQFNLGGNNDIKLNFADANGNLVSTNQNTLTTGKPLHTVGQRVMELALKFYF